MVGSNGINDWSEITIDIEGGEGKVGDKIECVPAMEEPMGEASLNELTLRVDPPNLVPSVAKESTLLALSPTQDSTP